MSLDNESPIPISNSTNRKSADLLPRFYRTDANKKFLFSTLDQLIRPGTVKKVSGYIGRNNAKSVQPDDIFINAANKIRQDYQLEPAAVIQDRFGNIDFFKDYIDHIGHIDVLNGNTDNHSRLNRQEFYSWNPHINWDKFVNFQQYYWLPYGPDPIDIAGQQLAIDSTYTVILEDQGDSFAYLFTPDGLTRNPTITLYRGQTYRFDINSPEHPFSIKNLRSLGFLDRYTNNTNIVNQNAVTSGQVIFNVPPNAPDVLYYVSEVDPNVGGSIVIKDIEENTFLDVEKDIIGKKNYVLPNGLSLSNGMKLNFIGNTSPSMYKDGFWLVEGVGEAISLINANDLEIVGTYTQEDALLFDDDPFDAVPFSTRTTYPKNKDYIVVNRSSKDKNPWSRVNRWFHQDVVRKTAELRGDDFSLDQNLRATRPIIEFNANLKLYNFGHVNKKNVDVIDNYTTDVFSTIEGSLGYNIDGIDLADGMRVLFTADPDRLVNGKIFQVKFLNLTVPGRKLNFSALAPSDSAGSVNIATDTIKCDTDHRLINGDRVIYLSNGNIQLQGLIHRQIYYVKIIDQQTLQLYTDSLLQNVVDILATGDSIHSLEVFSGYRRQINLVETEDSVPLLNETVLVNKGMKESIKFIQNGKSYSVTGNQGLMYWYNGSNWLLGQVKFDVNQPLYFDVFDKDENSYGDSSIYDGSSFKGTKLFSYKVGTGSSDSELGFSLSYRNINNVGDIVFNFDLLNDTFSYKNITNVINKKLNVGYLKIIKSLDTYEYVNGWVKSKVFDSQPVVRVFKNEFTEQVLNGVKTQVRIVNNFPIDTFDENIDLSDLKVKVYINGKKVLSSEFSVIDGVVRKEVVLKNDAKITDVVTLKLFSKQPKNQNGHYEIPLNLQNNPLNNDLTSFTLGEVIDHANSIVDNVDTMVGLFPGESNLRDLGDLTAFGTRFVQHSGPLNLALYALGSKDFNVVSALEKARNDYGRFKTAFLVLASEIGVQTEPKQLVDIILSELNKDKPKTDSYFLSDMFAYTANKRFEYKVLDERTKIYPLNSSFSLDELSNKAVLIYKNNVQLVHGKDYQFNNSFFTILSDLQEDDLLEVYEYETTDGSFCPPTPTKLGIYPAFEPKVYIDDTYLTPTTVIQGHDGSITIGFNDYRDQVLLELEKRIFNNIKIKYDPSIFDIFDYIPGHNRQLSYSKEEQEKILSQYFFQWSNFIQNDYTKQNNDLWDYLNPWTYNYRGFSLPDNTTLPAFWRGIYKWILDTDRPHTHPWECLGFSIEPRWWTEVYGPAPYTSDNYFLWDDIRDGIIREPGKSVKIVPKYAKSILNFGKPVNSNGQLINPIAAGYVKGLINPTQSGYYTFGDQGPVETAWRRSSYYPFSLLQSAILMEPAKVISLCYDRSRIVRNRNDQLVYSDTSLRLRLQDIVFPSIVSDNERLYSSGLINYIVNNFSIELSQPINKFRNELSSLTNKISSRLGGFTSKEKLKIILDSKNPSSTTGIFVPDENYKIFLNKGSPIQELIYSGIVLTKYNDGYEVRGYNKDQPYFKYYNYTSPGKEINIGGISESFINWDSGQRYISGQIVNYNNVYYRVKISHTSSENFDSSFYTKLNKLPLIGGRDIFIRKDFDDRTEYTVSYGTKFYTIQEVVDFILGYGKYLENQGFIFDDYNTNLKAVENWETSAKEFTFWTTQNWTEGSALSVSPAANNLNFKAAAAVIDNINDGFYGYKVFRVDGELLSDSFTSTFREDNAFNLKPKNTNHGIYGAVLRLVQKEHVLLLDNTTLFNDVIYDIEPGYKQDKVKIQGYLTTNWNGALNIPGFIYDEARVVDWEPWTDYNLGDIVFYKDFYYTASKFLPGTELLNEEDWFILDEKPESKLLPNWDYKAEQFTDYYDLDSDNFDIEQQRLAQHLIGYQKRQYLENIINDDISQYKFYQGMISEKGTQNVLNKLFDVLSSDNQESLTFSEEWAIRVGTYGASAIFDEIEFNLNEGKIKLNPQPIELTEEINYDPDFTYRIKTSDIVIKPIGYTHNIWPIGNEPQFLRTPGYVRYTDVLANVDTLDEILTRDISTFSEGDYVWAAFLSPPKLWTVYRFTKTNIRLELIEYKNGSLILTADSIPELSIGEIVGLDNISLIKGFYKIVDIIGRKIYITTKIDKWEKDLNSDSSICLVYKFIESRVDTVDNLNSFIPNYIKKNELLWVDNDGTNKHTVYEHSKVYTRSYVSTLNLKENNLLFGKSTSTSKDGLTAVISDEKQVTVFYRGIDSSSWKQQHTISSFSVNKLTFADKVCLSDDASWLAITETLSTLAEKVHFFKKNAVLGEYLFYQTISSPLVTGKNFGRVMTILKEDGEYIAAFGIPLDNKVLIYSITDENNALWNLAQDITSPSSSSTAKFGISLDLAQGALLVGSPGVSTAYLYTKVSSGYDLDETITDSGYPQNNINLGYSVALRYDAKVIALGAPEDDTLSVNSGRVDIFEKGLGNFYSLKQSIKSHYKKSYEKFGHQVFFMGADADTLVVLSVNGNVNNYSVFDNDTTTFDNNSLKFNDIKFSSGRIDIYDKYNENYIFGESLITDSGTDLTDDYAYSVSVGNNVVLASSIREDLSSFINLGQVFNYTKSVGSFSWTKKYQQSEKVFASKFKRAYLYDTDFNQLLKYLDIVDVGQGKIPGIADQEIRYKTYYDPAFYDIGTINQNVDEGQSWNKQHVGMLWWDLTRAKFIENNLGNNVYRSTNWNKLYETASVDVYEWIESKFKPSEWDSLSGTEKGDALGISGTSKYGNAVYSLRKTYDNVSQSFKNLYYYWVKNPTIIPNVADRKLSANDVSKLISDPTAQGYSCLGFTGSNSFILVNLVRFLKGDKTNLNIEYWTVEDHLTKSNKHSQWKLLSNHEKTIIPVEIETKWFDSLLGKDNNDRVVPNVKLPIKKRYGINNRPRQGMFVNRLEALKQFIEHTNSILLKRLIVDDYDISDLFLKDPEPSASTGLWDYTVETDDEIRFVDTSLVTQAKFSPVIEDGRIVDVNIVNSGYGYKNRPYLSISGKGKDALIRTKINAAGQVISVEILNQGHGYLSDTQITSRSFSVLVKYDSAIFGVWSIKEYNSLDNKFYKIKSQGYDTTKYWKYVDWYGVGYNQFTKIDHLVENTYKLATLSANIGQIVKVENVGAGGWLLLYKKNNLSTLDYTENFDVIGRKNGTIQFLNNIYDFSVDIIGYDSNLYDSQYYDNLPVKELRIILNVLKNQILVDELYVEYLNLFFNSLRYILYEQPFVDWVSKTSFVKSKHNLGELKQKVTYKNDSLENFEDYIKEVKPYRTKIREYISSYNRLEQSSITVTDFDIPPYIDEYGNIKTLEFNINDDSTDNPNLSTYPWKHYKDNVGFKILDIKIIDGGSGYIANPIVKVIGNCKVPARVLAYTTLGKVNRLQILNPGSGYLTCPEIIIDGGLDVSGVQAKVMAVIESEVVRANKITMKFDRTSRSNNFADIDMQETLSGTGSQLQFVLRYAARTDRNTYSVTVNGLDILKDDYVITVKESTSRGYTSYYGVLTFETAPVRNAVIVVDYKVGFQHLNALDRITHYYDPSQGMIGNDFAQLMSGIDYGGVDIQGLVNFVGTGGWDSDNWGDGIWGEENDNFEDQIFEIDESSSYGPFRFNYIPALGQQINVYLKRPVLGEVNEYVETRLDDPNFGTLSPLTNLSAVMQTIVGDGTTSEYMLPNLTDTPPLDLEPNDIIIFRKITSDGSISPKPQDFDTQLQGGNLAYTTATGLSPSDINVDGDGLVTPLTSYAPEEIVPGQVVDAVGIKVFQLPSSASTKIMFKNFIGDGVSRNFAIQQIPQNASGVIVKVASQVKKRNVDYTFEWHTRSVHFTSAPPLGSVISVISIGYTSDKILDLDYFVADGSTVEFITSAVFTENLGHIVLVDGELFDYEVFETDSEYSAIYRVGIRFGIAPPVDSIISYIITDDQNFSASVVKSEQIPTDGSTSQFALTNTIGIKDPLASNVLVIKNGQILNPSLNEYFTLSNNILTYTMSKYEQVPGTIDPSKIEVFLNGEILQIGIDYTLDLTGFSVILNSTAYVNDGILIVSNLVDSQYKIENSSSSTSIIFSSTPLSTDYIEIISFYNHDILDIARTQESISTSSALQPDTPDYYRYRNLQGGKFKLFKQVRIDDFVWIIKNNVLLSHSIDYYLDSDLEQIILANPLISTDILDVIIFSSGETTQGYGFMQFKDMLNRVHYKRLNKTKTTRLSQNLNQFDLEIHVYDASNLDLPDVSLTLPGIIEINGERIEYFEKSGNVLSKLRRGTLGTGVPLVHKQDTMVVCLGSSETIPYSDVQKIVRDVSNTVRNSISVTDFHLDKDQIEVFVGGQRLRKSNYSLFKYTNNYPYSPEGDEIVVADFSVSGTTINFVTSVPENVEVLVIKRTLSLWEDSETATIQESSTAPAKFIVKALPFYPEYPK
jgi:hypothetical protein